MHTFSVLIQINYQAWNVPNKIEEKNRHQHTPKKNVRSEVDFLAFCWINWNEKFQFGQQGIVFCTESMKMLFVFSEKSWKMRSMRKLTNKLLRENYCHPKQTEKQGKTRDVARKVNFVVSCVYVTENEKKLLVNWNFFSDTIKLNFFLFVVLENRCSVYGKRQQLKTE